jgi:hypothetical protein
MKIIVREANGLQIAQRREDGYINLTQMAQANNKDLYDYLRLNTTKAFLEELSLETGIPGSKIIQVRKGRGDRVEQGTWGHPYVAINCGQWCSPKFAVLVSKWVFEWMVTGRNPLSPKPAATPTDIQAELEELERLIISIRSQARTLHTGTHQPVDETLLKSLHSLTHNQLAVIASAIGLLQMLRQVAEMTQPTNVVDTTVEETIVDLPSSDESEVKTNFITSLPVLSTEATTRFTVALPLSLHHKLSVLAARTGRKKVDIVRMLLDEALSDIED